MSSQLNFLSLFQVSDFDDLLSELNDDDEDDDDSSVSSAEWETEEEEDQNPASESGSTVKTNKSR